MVQAARDKGKSAWQKQSGASESQATIRLDTSSYFGKWARAPPLFGEERRPDPRERRKKIYSITC